MREYKVFFCAEAQAQSMTAKRLESSNAKKEGAKAVALDAFAVLLDEPDSDAAQVAFEDDEVVDANKGLTVMVVLFTHWLEGNRVALLLKVISAHCLIWKSARAHCFSDVEVPTLYNPSPFLGLEVANCIDACVPSSIGRLGGSVNFGKQRFPAPVSLRGTANKLMLKLVAFTPSPRLTKMMAAPSWRVTLREPPSSGHSVRLVSGVSLIPAPISQT